MIEGYDIICFSYDWGGDPLSKKHIMQGLSRKNRVLWINSIGNRNPTASARDFRRVLKKLRDFFRGCNIVDENIYVFSPLVIPFHGNALARWINKNFLRWSLRLVCHKLGFRNSITWTFAPSSADVVGTLGEQLVIYHCVDEFSEFTGTHKAAILEMERRLIEKADLVIVSSSALYESKRRYNPKTFLVTHGVEIEHFRNACRAETTVPSDIGSLPSPVIGFFGLIADWVDLELIRFLALSRPRWSLVLIGKLDTDPSPLQGLPNVHLLGRKDYQLLPGYCKGFDVAILPFVVNNLTMAANPLKLREYLAAGLPVVATAIPEVERLDGLLSIGRSYEQFLEKIQALIAEGKVRPQPSISETMECESWDRKIEEMSEIITHHVQSKKVRVAEGKGLSR